MTNHARYADILARHRDRGKYAYLSAPSAAAVRPRRSGTPQPHATVPSVETRAFSLSPSRGFIVPRLYRRLIAVISGAFRRSRAISLEISALAEVGAGYENSATFKLGNR